MIHEGYLPKHEKDQDADVLLRGTYRFLNVPDASQKNHMMENTASYAHCD